MGLLRSVGLRVTVPKHDRGPVLAFTHPPPNNDPSGKEEAEEKDDTTADTGEEHFLGSLMNIPPVVTVIDVRWC